MKTYTVYHLTFNTQLHLGRSTGSAQKGNLGLEKTETYISADTLFSSICQTWANFYDTASLTDFLKPYTTDNALLPFTLTSAFPFAHNVYCFPKPLTFQVMSKKSKRVQFVSNNIFRQIINGNQPKFKEKNLINSEYVWISPEEKKQLKKTMDEEICVWKTDTRPRVTIGSQNAGSEIWYVETVEFNTNCGLWFAATFDSEETKQKIDTLLRVMGDSGIGGEKNAGYGMFDFCNEDRIELPTAQIGDQFITLSPICPKLEEQLTVLRTGKTAHALNTVNAPGKTNRKRIHLFSEGSVFHKSEEQIGCLVDLKPDTSAIPKYRYGFAWQVGIKGSENETEIST